MGVSLATLGSACYGLRYRFGASLRSALLTHPPHASRKLQAD
ncbi:MAG: glycogen/starch/alpha-glucan phosphorylase [Bacteroidia bacterium]|nr:glycogen/starch/alpha-glucan phosphorylase [Bacteroidia bacterium]